MKGKMIADRNRIEDIGDAADDMTEAERADLNFKRMKAAVEAFRAGKPVSAEYIEQLRKDMKKRGGRA